LIIAQKEKDLEKFKQSKEMDMEKQVTNWSLTPILRKAPRKILMYWTILRL
jgi:hypothetical protein